MPQWKEKNEKSGHSNSESFSEILVLLESNDTNASNKVKEEIRETLSSSKDSKLLNNLIEFYIATQSENAFDILLHVKEPHDKHMYEKINDMVKTELTRYSALQLLGRIVFKQPPWLHKISNQRLMQTLLNILKADSHSPNLLSGLFIIICILPLIPHQFGSLLSDTFDVFSRLAAWNIKKPSSLSEILNMHLQTGVYSLFHRLYGMYPCNFLAYLRSFYGGRDCTDENFEVFIQVIKPMLERVRLHPLLVTASKETELSVNRWKKMAYHDIVVECASISLDPIEGNYESFKNASLSVSSQTEDLSINDEAGTLNDSSLSTSSVIVDAPLVVNEKVPSDQEQIWSPSEVCGTSSFSYSSNNLSLPSVAKGEWEFKNVMQSSTEESIPLDFAVEAKPELLKSDLEASEKFYEHDFNNIDKDSNSNAVKMQKSEIFSQNSTESDIIVINQGKNTSLTETKEDDVDREVSELTTQTLEHSLNADDVREDTPFCSTTQNLTDEPANLMNTIMSLSERSDSLTKSTEDDTDEMYNSMQESDLQSCVPFPRYRFISHCGPVPEIVSVNKKPEIFRSASCPADFFLPMSNSTELDISNAVISKKTDTTTETYINNMTITTSSAFVSLPSETSLSKTKILPAYQQLLPAVVNPSLFLDPPVTIRQQNTSQNKMPKYFSPPELLDIYIQQGNATYLNSLPLTSRKETDWTHFGGKPPPDEIEVLKNQILLLHNMLLFERHRKDIHSERNRRILGRIKRARMHEEFIEALKSEILILTNENVSLKRELCSLNKVYSQHMNQRKKNETDLDSKISKLGQEKTQLLFSIKKLQSLLVSQKEENDEITGLYKNVQCEVASMKCQLRYARQEVQHYQKVKKEAIFLTKQLILLQELIAHYKNKLDQTKPPQQPNITSTLMENSMRSEIAGLKQKLDAKSVLLDSSKGRVMELENKISNLKLNQKERTSSCEAMKRFHQAEITVQNERLLDLQKIAAEKDAHILKLFADTDELRDKLESLKRQQSSSSKSFKDSSGGHKPSNLTATDGCSISQRTDDALS